MTSPIVIRQALEGRASSPLSRVALTETVPVAFIPFTALLAEVRSYAADGAHANNLTYPTGSGSTNYDGSEETDEPMEDDEIKK